MIRLDELSQSNGPVYRRLLNVVLTSQQADGGWGDPMTTAMCIRALLCGGGDGSGVVRGLGYLASLQQPKGSWPREPLRRMPSDAFATVFILMQLGDRDSFRRAVRFDDTVAWMTQAGGAKQLDGETSRLWSHAALRCRAGAYRPVPALFATTRPAA
jgi:hypothetical protein